MKTITRAAVGRILKTDEKPTNEQLKDGRTHVLEGGLTACGRKVPGKDPRWMRDFKPTPDCAHCKKALKGRAAAPRAKKVTKPKAAKVVNSESTSGEPAAV